MLAFAQEVTATGGISLAGSKLSQQGRPDPSGSVMMPICPFLGTVGGGQGPAWAP